MSAAPVLYLDPPTHIDPTIPDGHVGSIEFLNRTGITYRRLDYWTRCRLLRTPDTKPGSGHPRTWPADEIPVAILMRQLSAAGLDIRAAHDAARELLTTGYTTLAGIRLDLPEQT